MAAKTVVITFVYPGVEPYLEALCRSLNAQTFTDFELWIFNDGLLSAENHFKSLRMRVVVTPVSGNIFSVRLHALEAIAHSPYTNIIFQDADDLMTPNRISVSSRYLEDFDLVANDLSTIDVSGKILQESVWAERLAEGFVFAAGFLRRWNIAGLGNTAIRRNLLGHPVISTDLPLVAADWFIFFQLMESAGARGVFTSACRTLYRQHEANLAGIGSYSADSLEKAIAVKKAHYAALTAAGFDFHREIADIYDLQTKPKTNPKLTPGALFWWEDTEI